MTSAAQQLRVYGSDICWNPGVDFFRASRSIRCPLVKNVDRLGDRRREAETKGRPPNQLTDKPRKRKFFAPSWIRFSYYQISPASDLQFECRKAKFFDRLSERTQLT